MNEERIGKCLWQVEYIRGHLWHRYSIQVMVATVKLSANKQIGYIGFLQFVYFIVYLFSYVDFYTYGLCCCPPPFLCSVSRSYRWLLALLMLVELLAITVDKLLYVHIISVYYHLSYSLYSLFHEFCTFSLEYFI